MDHHMGQQIYINQCYVIVNGTLLRDSIKIYRDIYIYILIIILFSGFCFLQFLVKLINLMEFELIWLDGWLNWPRGIIFRQDSEPKSLQTHRNLFEHTKKHLPKKSNNAKFSENRFLLENSFVKSRPHMAALADPQSGKYSYIDPLSFIVSKKDEKNWTFTTKT